ncbi:hypothetical protein RF11_15522 [Thelohanellus kitauei]|uniref:Uncharacterized protein n=1 Tax=Thelohanellus kitauei TaxID=669202 RepID=A0A0C2NFR4_THEKT|nr:hypothetical protein RF11_15522 [Thelohanellus kitauei]
MRAPILSPTILKTTFDYFENHELPQEFWKLTEKYYLVIFYKLYAEPESIDQITFISKNREKSFISHKPTYIGKPLYSHTFYGAKNILYGISDLNQIFFYADNELNIFPAKPYERDGLAIQSPYDPIYIFKMVVKNLTVSQSTNNYT